MAAIEWCWLQDRVGDARPVVDHALAISGPVSADYVELARWVRRAGLGPGPAVPDTAPAAWLAGLRGD